ncbi:MAG: hypothetical protein R2684_17670 [Pyrinomonadaceae bacterium]
MEIQQVTTVLVFLSLALSVFSLLRNRHNRRELEFGANQLELLDVTLQETMELIEGNLKTSSDHARRIAWLDAKVRQSRYFSIKEKNSTAIRDERRPSIEERRERILRMSDEGYDCDMIATHLGLMPGEVQLILNLNSRPAAVA